MTKVSHKIENLFAKLKDWRRIAIRYDAPTRPSVSLPAVAFYLNQWIGRRKVAFFPFSGHKESLGARRSIGLT
jgi:hypothetical protein